MTSEHSSVGHAADVGVIPTVIGNRRQNRNRNINNRHARISVLQSVRLTTVTTHHHRAITTTMSSQHVMSSMPTLYVLNADALSKPGAVDHLTVDLKSTVASVAVITETHFKQKHTDSVIGIDNYTVFRRDRAGRRGGGIALYVNSSIQSSVWSPSLLDNRAFEMLWVRVGVTLFAAALCHPPRPVYRKY